MVRDYLIKRFKNIRRQQYLNENLAFKNQYASIGAGNHSLNTLYPCIRHLEIPLKYICTAHLSNAQKMRTRFPDATATDNINDIISDPQVKGVFVCLPSSMHFATVKKLLAASKHVFVEKPPCYSASELRELISLQKQLVCMTGLQKRFSGINALLVNKTSKTTSYTVRYLTGAYPEGDPVFDLFIHPIDNVIQLFGAAKPINISKTKHPHGLTVFITLEHVQGTIGSLELSTDYSWSGASDNLVINNERETLKADYPNFLSGTVKSKTIFGLPVEKALKKPAIIKMYLNSNEFSTSFENNSLVMQGFYGEIKHFVRSVEKNDLDDKAGLGGLLPVYELLAAIQQA